MRGTDTQRDMASAMLTFSKSYDSLEEVESWVGL